MEPTCIPYTVKKRFKTWPEFFAQTWNGFKKFELRKDEHEIEAGDCVCLDEWNPKTKEYTGLCVVVVALYVIRDKPQFGLAYGHCIFSFNGVEKFGGTK